MFPESMNKINNPTHSHEHTSISLDFLLSILPFSDPLDHLDVQIPLSDTIERIIAPIHIDLSKIPSVPSQRHYHIDHTDKFDPFEFIKVICNQDLLNGVYLLQTITKQPYINLQLCMSAMICGDSFNVVLPGCVWQYILSFNFDYIYHNIEIRDNIIDTSVHAITRFASPLSNIFTTTCDEIESLIRCTNFSSCHYTLNCNECRSQASNITHHLKFCKICTTKVCTQTDRYKSNCKNRNHLTMYNTFDGFDNELLICDYLGSYVDRFNCRECIQFDKHLRCCLQCCEKETDHFVEQLELDAQRDRDREEMEN